METVLVKGRGEGRELAGLDEKGPNLFSGRPSTPSPAKRPTTVWPSSYNPYYTKRTERPPPPSEERVERPEQKLRGGQSTGEACILSSGPPSPALSFLQSCCYYSDCIILSVSSSSPPRFSTPRTQTHAQISHASPSPPSSQLALEESRSLSRDILHLRTPH